MACYKAEERKKLTIVDGDEPPHPCRWKQYKLMQFIRPFVEINKSQNRCGGNDESPMDAAGGQSSTTAAAATFNRVVQSDEESGGGGGGAAEESKIIISPPKEYIRQELRPYDEHTAFGEFIAAELRRLPSDEAQLLRRRLNRSLLDFYDEFEVRFISYLFINVFFYYYFIIVVDVRRTFKSETDTNNGISRRGISGCQRNATVYQRGIM